MSVVSGGAITTSALARLPLDLQATGAQISPSKLIPVTWYCQRELATNNVAADEPEASRKPIVGFDWTQCDRTISFCGGYNCDFVLAATINDETYGKFPEAGVRGQRQLCRWAYIQRITRKFDLIFRQAT